ncbi:MAG: methylenetetrahydrofolate--tRNA-(uracil(54)-C(5))-methyltransferase (FADH(2)-oxidizing) TrmFO [Clostridiales bacterium]|nr:methylenetetrahydrofolate--tRNA-(uracil(54)-C(5))-methyltransferase (FADH(2)-oxidizing) TrmFO [Clostridiales bacterium]
MSELYIIGAGLAGCEAAWQAAKRGVKVTLFEMKPYRYSPAHKSEGFAELVCSNSLRAMAVTNAVGLLKEEMRALGSLIIEAADATSVPAGAALAVDREKFSEYITDKISSEPNIKVIREEVKKIPDSPCIVASGPLTDGELAEEITSLCGAPLNFYDAVAPIVDASSIDYDKAFFASRWNKGDDGDYLNCPMEKDEYKAFYDALVSAETVPMDAADDGLKVFEGCMPVETMAKRGEDTIRFGPLKPVGITNPKNDKRYYAIVQLRAENRAKTMYNLVGFQTRLTWPEQRRVFRLIPGLEGAEFLRYGVMHRNSYIDSPRLLDSLYMLKSRPGLWFAGQLAGVEGYVESASSGLVAGLAAATHIRGTEPPQFPRYTATGALSGYISDPFAADFQPMNINFGIMEEPDTMSALTGKQKHDKRARAEKRAEAALKYINELRELI